uniref:Complement inhibitor n=1 Tax=Dermacentor reticulatus TaxID=57047 RepID=B6E210_DERRT|nr:complement inhibitor [Dermacentor reticulatus]
MLVLATLIFSFSASVAYADSESDCSGSEPVDAFQAFSEGEEAYVLVRSTDPKARDCLKGEPAGEKQDNTLPVMMTFKNGTDWASTDWTFTLDGAKVTATLGNLTQNREVVYDSQSHHCHVDKVEKEVPDYEMWMLDAGGLEVEVECRRQKLEGLASGRNQTYPHLKDS